jgi:hypothetical protein
VPKFVPKKFWYKLDRLVIAQLFSALHSSAYFMHENKTILLICVDYQRLMLAGEAGFEPTFSESEFQINPQNIEQLEFCAQICAHQLDMIVKCR